MRYGLIARRLFGPLYKALPVATKREIRTKRLEHIVRRRRFNSDEYEFGRLHEWLTPGDTAIDVGANFGTYTLRMAELVGNEGRVFSFEPVPQTFAILTRLLNVAGCKNVTALNLACSDQNRVASIAIPDESLTGEDLYRATVMDGGSSPIPICCVRLDDVALPLNRLRVVKIDAERHEDAVVLGMWNIVSRYRPVMIIEHLSSVGIERLLALGYRREHKDKSPNSIFIPVNNTPNSH